MGQKDSKNERAFSMNDEQLKEKQAQRIVLNLRRSRREEKRKKERRRERGGRREFREEAMEIEERGEEKEDR